ncbi:MATE family efflux transporter [Atopobacter sp. AH10]|uniref:MATE family efflux transporter n=1 Tax=Atopobacter sp. AH10 TaxID=2315861 RepID=UPI000EF17B61|nr:MATE family efflux transporter [Atopobacter sp. AH10]RLK62589.1 MATE family efflux transporter [Atopobacter sp. AH10]
MTNSKEYSLKRYGHYIMASMVGIIGASIYVLADTYFIANGVGADGLAALNIALPVWNLMNGLNMMVGVGSAIYFSIHSDPSSRQRSFSTALSFGLVLAIVEAVLLMIFHRPIAVLLGASPRLFPLVRTYMLVIVFFAPVAMVNMILGDILRNDGAPKRAMVVQLCGSLVNCVADYILIYPLGMGMFGAALATGVSPILGIFVALPHFMKKDRVKLRLGPLRFELIVNFIRLGLATLILELSNGVILLVFNRLLLGVAGEMGVAAYGIVANVGIVTNALFNGVAQGSQPLISESINKTSSKGTHYYYRLGLGTIAGISLISYAIIALGAESIANAFNEGRIVELQDLAVRGLRLYFLALPFTGFNLFNTMFFSASNQSRRSLVLSMMRGFVVILPLVVGLATIAGVDGIWLAVMVTEWVTIAFCLKMRYFDWVKE